MKKTCHACGEQISDIAKICPVCMSSQSRFLFVANSLIGMGSLVISALSLIVAFVALYFSQVSDPESPRVEVQINEFEEGSFSFFVSNMGNLPTSIGDFDLSINLLQGDDIHSVRAGFTIPSIQLNPGESHLIELKYSSFVLGRTQWITAEDLDEPFTLHFLHMASLLGSNLHCQVEVYFTSRKYFPSNVEGATGSVNGQCSSAMKWFAEHVGPLNSEVMAK